MVHNEGRGQNREMYPWMGHLVVIHHWGLVVGLVVLADSKVIDSVTVFMRRDQ